MASSALPPDPSALDDLPQEVLVRIASFLTTAELGPFRRTCKQVEAKLFNTFALEFFTKRQFMLEHESLQALVGISRHPGLGAKLTEVIIGTQTLSAGIELVQDRMLHGRLTRDALLQTGTARDMLAEAFSNLPNLRTAGLRDYDGAGRLRDGPDARWRSWGWSFGSQGASQDPSQILPVLLRALGRAKARPTNIDVLLRKWPHLRSEAFQLISDDSGQDTLAVLAEVKTLMLANSRGGDAASADNLAPWGQYNDHNFVEAPLRHFLHSASRLEALRLNFDNSFIGHRIIDWLSRPSNTSPLAIQPDIFHIPPVKLIALSTLDFGMTNVPGDVLVRALTKFNLKSFSLWKMTLQCPAPDSLAKDCWAEFLEQLSAALPPTTLVRSISIGLISQEHYCPSQPHGRHTLPTRFVAEGTDTAAKAKAVKTDCIAFKAQFTHKTVHQWLMDMSELTFVPGIHTSRSSSTPSTIGEGLLEELNSESDEEAMEDESDVDEDA